MPSLDTRETCEGQAPNYEYVVNGRKYNIGYYLSDGIYPRQATFVKSVLLPQSTKDRLFAECQETVRKDVKRAFESFNLNSPSFVALFAT